MWRWLRDPLVVYKQAGMAGVEWTDNHVLYAGLSIRETPILLQKLKVLRSFKDPNHL